MPGPYDTVSFLSDYGTADEFVGVVKSVLRSLAPQAAVIDVAHDVPAHDVRAGALALVRAAQYLAPGVVLAVVDPGVGTDRRAIAVEVGDAGEAVFVGPDNGLLAPAVSMVGGARRVVELTDDRFHLPAPGATFAGRDVFAPVAAHLCNGVDLGDLGPAVDAALLVPSVLPVAEVRDGALHAEVLWIDRYGNVQLNVGPEDVAELGDPLTARVGDEARVLAFARAYAAIPPGTLALVVDSYGLVSIAADRHPAAQDLRVQPGDRVTLTAAG